MSERLTAFTCLLLALALLAGGCGGASPEKGAAWAPKSAAADKVTYEGVDLSATIDWRAGATARYWWELSGDGGGSWTRASRVRGRGPKPVRGREATITDELRPSCPAGSTRCSPYHLRADKTYRYRICAKERSQSTREVCFAVGNDELGGPWKSFTTSPRPRFTGDFETGDASQYNQVQCLPGRLQVGKGAPAAALSGQWARFEVREGDVEPETGYEGRCEALPGPTVTDGQDVWQRFSVLFAPGFTTTNYLQFAQWHASGGYGEAALAFRVEGGSHRMELTHGGGTVRYWSGPALVPGRRYDFVAHINFDDDPRRGFVELWLDGKRQTMEGGGRRASGPTSDPCVRAGCPDPDPSSSVYPKLGIYRSRTDTNRVVLYADDFLLGRAPSSIGFSP